MMAIGVFCNDHAMFERALNYYENGAGDGRLTHYVINGTGQCQESGRDQQHTQLGLAHLGDCCEIAWHQGLDLYGYNDNLLLKGFEYTARYNLGRRCSVRGNIGSNRKISSQLIISTEGRGTSAAVFEEIYNHYANQMGIPAPFTKRAAESIRPEGSGGPGADHVGFGTLLFTRPSSKGAMPFQNSPVSPGGVIAEGSPRETRLTWVAAVGAQSYTVKRAAINEDYKIIARDITKTTYTDNKVKAGGICRYVISALNTAGESPGSFPVSIGVHPPTAIVGASRILEHPLLRRKPGSFPDGNVGFLFWARAWISRRN